MNLIGMIKFLNNSSLKLEKFKTKYYGIMLKGKDWKFKRFNIM